MTTVTTIEPLEFTFRLEGPAADPRPRDFRVNIGKGYSAFMAITIEGEKRVTAQLPPSAVRRLLEALTDVYVRGVENLAALRERLDLEAEAADAGEGGLAGRIQAADELLFGELLEGLEQLDLDPADVPDTPGFATKLERAQKYLLENYADGHSHAIMDVQGECDRTGLLIDRGTWLRAVRAVGASYTAGNTRRKATFTLTPRTEA